MPPHLEAPHAAICSLPLSSCHNSPAYPHSGGVPLHAVGSTSPATCAHAHARPKHGQRLRQLLAHTCIRRVPRGAMQTHTSSMQALTSGMQTHVAPCEHAWNTRRPPPVGARNRSSVAGSVYGAVEACTGGEAPRLQVRDAAQGAPACSPGTHGACIIGREAVCIKCEGFEHSRSAQHVRDMPVLLCSCALPRLLASCAA